MAENYLERLKKAITDGWRQFFDALRPDQHQLLLDLLREVYREEAQDVMQLAQHVERMHYPQFRERFRRIAAQEQAHLTWLRDRLRALGGDAPDVSLPPKSARNGWEALLRDLEEEKRSYVELLEAMHIAEEVDRELAEGLRRIREEEQQHREQILEMLEKSDPYTLPQGPSEENPLGGPAQGGHKQL
jgi:rubrerythrin